MKNKKVKKNEYIYFLYLKFKIIKITYNYIFINKVINIVDIKLINFNYQIFGKSNALYIRFYI